ncbi:MAG: hypothetical protein COA78_36980 [Blastopirellula sp.]|nr:MAG: hypothetical protein COA78_36980 [Blastopirellula sp.]
MLFAQAFECIAEGQEIAKGNLLMEFDFSSNELGEKFIVKRGVWKVKDGVLSGNEIESEHHAASCHLIQETKNAIFEFRLKSSTDAMNFNVGFDPVKGELNKVGHIHAVSITSKIVSMTVAGDKKSPKENPAARLGRAKLNLKNDTWYQVRLINIGDECRVSIDGKTLLVGKHPEIAVRKPAIIFRAFGEGIQVDDIRIWEIK